ncbi:hypothetical protein [Mesorhizobium sp. 1B3]|uniref:hypothetical protein n=1 Tax=Mesorhizobium sp. 1B3 TaxID=3243599 RepID=UPI003D96D154
MIETAIRNAFEKGDATDRAFREKVYRSAFAALDRALKANPNVTVEAAINRRKNLQARIAEIETEFIPAVSDAAPEIEVAPDVPAASQAPASVEIDRPDHRDRPVTATTPEVTIERGQRAGRQEPVMGAHPVSPPVAPEVGDDIRAEPRLPSGNASGNGKRPAAAEAELSAQPERVVEPERRRRYPAIFIAVTLLSLAAIGGWWGYNTGLFKSPAEIDTSVPNPPAVTGEEDFDPDEEPIGEPAKPGEADAQRDWINVFSPEDPTQVNAPGDTKAEVMEDESGSFIRIRSGPAGSAITFDVGQGVLEQLAGKRVVFDIVARAEEGKETQISVDCNFGELGGCGRKRYAVGYEQGEFLFEIELPNKRPGAEGSIAINSDLSNEGKAIDVYEIKASVAQ